jgi:hypothetical protein
MGVAGEEHALDAQLEELFLVPADAGGNGGGGDRRLQVVSRFDGLGAAAHEELVVDVLRGEGVEREAGVAA